MRREFANWERRPDWLRMPQLASRVFYTPLIIDPRKLHVILDYLTPRMGWERPDVETRSFDARYVKSERERKPYEVVDNVAIIDVFGSLVHRASWMNAFSGISSYQQLGAEIDVALEDSDVDTILLLVDSPGGECSGAWDLADKIYNARSQKRIVALAEDLAASAGYLIASSAEEVYTTQTGVLGSIGIVLSHYDVTESNRKWGIKVTEIHAGARKVDCSPNQVLDEEKLASLQEHVDSFYNLFVAAVERNRGLSAEAIRATEAGIYVGAEAVDAGLADGTSSLEELLSTLTGRAESIAVPKAPNAQRARVPIRITAEQVRAISRRRRPPTNARSRSMPTKPKAGENLGNLLEESIQRQVTEERSREQVVQEMADAAETDTETVEQIIAGDLNCPTMATLEAFATVLDATVDEMVAAATEDGCEYDTESDADSSSSDEAGGEGSDASSAKGEVMRHKGKGGATSLQAERDKAVARAEAAEAALAEVTAARKNDVIKKHQKEGRVTPAMLKSVKKLAATCESAEELDELLAAYPKHLNVPGGKPVSGANQSTELSEEEHRLFKGLGVTKEALGTYSRVRSLSIGKRGTVEATLDDETVIDINDIRGEA